VTLERAAAELDMALEFVARSLVREELADLGVAGGQEARTSDGGRPLHTHRNRDEWMEHPSRSAVGRLRPTCNE
jgi:hypothetical protein